MDTTTIIILCVIGVAVLGYLAYWFIKFRAMTKEDKVKTIKSYVTGLITFAEKEIGAGHGAQKLELVENCFKEKAPFAYKIILSMLGKENLTEIIEDALRDVKKAFGKED